MVTQDTRSSLCSKRRDEYVWPSKNRRSGASDHQKKWKIIKKLGITRPRPDGGVIKSIDSQWAMLNTWCSVVHASKLLLAACLFLHHHATKDLWWTHGDIYKTRPMLRVTSHRVQGFPFTHHSIDAPYDGYLYLSSLHSDTFKPRSKVARAVANASAMHNRTPVKVRRTSISLLIIIIIIIIIIRI